MTPRRVLTVDDLRQELRREGSTVPEPVAVFLRALDHRMNSNSVLASVPMRAGEDPAVAFAEWLDRGAPGLAEAAKSCGWDGRLAEVARGAAPTLTPLGANEFVDALRAKLTTSTSFYDVELAEPERILEAFLHAEFGGAGERELTSFRFFRVPVAALERLTRYFDGFGNDDCLIWNRDAMRVLFVNGGD